MSKMKRGTPVQFTDGSGQVHTGTLGGGSGANHVYVAVPVTGSKYSNSHRVARDKIVEVGKP